MEITAELGERIVASLPYGVVLHSPTGEIVSANAAAERILGLTLAQMRGRTPTDPRWRTIREDGSPFPGEEHPASISLITRQAVKNVIMGVYSPRWKGMRQIAVNAIPLLGRARRLQGVYAVFEDITEQKLAESGRRESEQKYSNLVNQAADCIFMLDDDERFLEVNASGQRMLGYTLTRLRRMTLPDVVAGGSLLTAPRNASNADETVVMECVFRRRDKSTFIGELVGRRLPNGRLQGIVRDVTERMTTLQVLEESRSQLAQALDGSNLGSWHHDIRGGTMAFDRRWHDILGYPEDLYSGDDARWLSLVHPDDVSRMTQARQQHLAGDTPGYSCSFRLRHRDGHWLWVNSTGRVTLRDPAGKPLRFSGTLRDISSEMRLKLEVPSLLHQVESMVKQLSVSMNPESRPGRNPDGPLLESLSSRQRQILVMIAEGMTSAKIASALGIKTTTVVSHRRSLMHHLGIHNTAGLSRFALAHGLLAD